jgi:hypothetical protein
MKLKKIMIKQIPLVEIKTAYLLLKNYFYYDNTDLYVKKQIAEYETRYGNNPKNLFRELSIQIHEILANPQHINVDFHFIPKGVVDNESVDKETTAVKDIQFISNFKRQDTYKLKVNYFIDIDIPARVLDVLWVMSIGKKLDDDLQDNIYANRLNDFATIPAIGNVLFKKYATQYAFWRDKALTSAKNLLKEEKNVIIMSMDLKSFYYSIDINFNELKAIKSTTIPNLSHIIEIIHQKYQSKITKYLKITHETDPNRTLPIGLLSSSVLSNWYLQKFDNDILEKANPIYYGRYVDDILIVKHTNKTGNLNKDTCVKECLGDLLSQKGDSLHYKKGNIDITFQKNKFIAHYLDKDHSAASLKIFETEINKNTSMFRFLPNSDVQANLQDAAYDLFYYGSKYRFRSIVNFKENSTKFSTYLSSQIILHRLTNKVNNEDTIKDDVNKFFKGRNFLDFARFWLKYFYFLTVIEDKDEFDRFEKDIANVIQKTELDTNSKADSTAKLKLRNDLKEYLSISKNLALALQKIESNTPVKAFRNSNMMNNAFVSFPLINFTNYTDSTISVNMDSFSEKMSENKIELSPRFIHLDEFILFKTNGPLHSGKEIKYDDILKKYDNIFNNNENRNKYSEKIKFKPIETYQHGANILKISVKDNISKKHLKFGLNNNEKNFSKTVRIGIVNTKIDEKQIEKSYKYKGKHPDLSQQRQTILFDLLNRAIKENVNILIFPELSIPYKWLPQMLQFSRRNQISLIFGMEYIIAGQDNRTAYNYVVTTLPFINDKYTTVLPVIRLKNHYSPWEEKVLINHNYVIPQKPYFYHFFDWNGLNFTTFICFEMADILHRAIFKMNLDLLTCCVWNKDINYYDRMLYSTVRDLHCYLAQSNTSQYGNSCILQPKKMEEHCMVNIKGGKNSTIITEDLDIAAIKYYHSLKRNSLDPAFKPMPPGEKGLSN